MSFPFDIKNIESDLNKQVLSDFQGERTTFLQVGPKNYFLPSRYRREAGDFYNFKTRPDDVWICTYPRSGTTIMQELIWLLVHDLDYESAASTPLFQRSHFLEGSILIDDGVKQDMIKLARGDPTQEAIVHDFAASVIPELNSEPSPRVIKSHLSFSLLPPALLDTCKTVYVARNPKDMAASYYHHNRLLSTHGYVGDFPKYWNYFERDLITFSPYWEHIREGWENKNNENMLFIFYEDLVKDMRTSIRNIANFLGKQISDEQVETLAQHLHIDNFRKYFDKNMPDDPLPGLIVEGEQGFIRKGQNGSWKAEFTPELSSRADKWIADNIATIPGFKFPEP